jgi:penicillin-binding protein 1C
VKENEEEFPLPARAEGQGEGPERRRRKLKLAIATTALLIVSALAARLTCPPLLEPYGFSRQVHDRDGKLLRLSLAPGDTYRVWTELEQISPQLVEATLAYEDRWFWVHPGVNPVALAKAAISTYVTGERRRGGSTLTMQLARLRYGLDSRTPSGKLVQIARAVQLELSYSKHDLLEAYLNLAPYGGNVEGVGAAARVYFHKDVRGLSLPEALALAVMPQSPSARTPAARVEPAGLRTARAKLAGLWLQLHPATKREALALDEALQLFTTRDLPFLAPHAVERALATRQGDMLTLTLDGSLRPSSSARSPPTSSASPASASTTPRCCSSTARPPRCSRTSARPASTTPASSARSTESPPRARPALPSSRSSTRALSTRASFTRARC